MSLAETVILSKLENVKRSGAGWTARCPGPGHERGDTRNSLSIGNGDEGQALLYCHAGCETAAVIAALDLTMADLSPPRPDAIARNGHAPRIVAEYDYRDEAGTLLYQVVRREPKDFAQRRPDGKGDWLWTLGDVRRVPYRLPELLAADPDEWVLIVEGEKDADRLAALGFTATTNSAGAAKWPDDFAPYFKGRKVALIPDNDLPGGRHVIQVARSLDSSVRTVRIVHLPDLDKKGGDVSDWLDAGGSADALVALIEDALDFGTSDEPEPEPEPIGELNRGVREPVGMIAADVQPERVVWLSPGRLAAGKATILDGDPGLGKSTLSLELGARITRGDALPGGQPGDPRGVVVLSAEDGIADTIVPRLIAAGADLSRVYIMTGIATANGDDDTVTVPGTLDAVETAITRMDAALLIVDPLVAFLGGDVNSNRDQDVRRAMKPLAAMLERTGCAGLLLRHLNKAAGGQAIYRGGGSIGIVGAARFGLLAARDPDDDEARILAPVKVNIGPESPALPEKAHTGATNSRPRLDRISMPFEIDHGLITINPIGGVPAYGRRPAKGERRIGLCAYCKRARPITRDHVVPRGLFEQDADSLIRVPSCDECQDAKEAGEERLRDLVRIDVGGSDHGDSLSQIMRIGRAHLRNPGRSTERIMARRQIEVTSFGGIYLGEAFEIDWDFAPILRTMEFVARGLWFHVNREALPRHADVGVSFTQPLDRARVHAWLSPFRVTELFVLGNGVAHIEAFDTFSHTRVDSLWRIVFNFGVLFIAGTGAYARYVRGLSDRREVDGYYDPRICYARR